MRLLSEARLQLHFYNQGVFTEGPFDPREDPIGSLLTYAGCSPGKSMTIISTCACNLNIDDAFFILGYCFCKDNPEKEVDARPQVFRIVQDLCPRGEINRYGEKNLDWE